MKKAIGGFVLGTVVGVFVYMKLLSTSLAKGLERGPVVYEDENIKIKRSKLSNGKMMEFAWVFDKKESEQ